MRNALRWAFISAPATMLLIAATAPGAEYTWENLAKYTVGPAKLTLVTGKQFGAQKALFTLSETYMNAKTLAITENTGATVNVTVAHIARIEVTPDKEPARVKSSSEFTLKVVGKEKDGGAWEGRTSWPYYNLCVLVPASFEPKLEKVFHDRGSDKATYDPADMGKLTSPEIEELAALFVKGEINPRIFPLKDDGFILEIPWVQIKSVEFGQ